MKSSEYLQWKREMKGLAEVYNRYLKVSTKGVQEFSVRLAELQKAYVEGRRR